MNCDICKISVNDAALHRVNEKGVKGIWRCEGCMSADDKLTLDPVVQEILAIIEDDNKRNYI